MNKKIEALIEDLKEEEIELREVLDAIEGHLVQSLEILKEYQPEFGDGAIFEIKRQEAILALIQSAYQLS